MRKYRRVSFYLPTRCFNNYKGNFLLVFCIPRNAISFFFFFFKLPKNRLQIFLFLYVPPFFNSVAKKYSYVQKTLEGYLPPFPYTPKLRLYINKYIAECSIFNVSRIPVVMISHDPCVPQQAVGYVLLILHEALQCTVMPRLTSDPANEFFG